MRILLHTDYFIPKREAVPQLDAFDATFSKRYLDEDGDMVAEKHWESDKYNIFFLDVKDKDVQTFVDTFKKYDWCYTIAPVDSSYNMQEKPLFVTDQFNELAKKMRKTYEVPMSVRKREADFQPRQPRQP